MTDSATPDRPPRAVDDESPSTPPRKRRLPKGLTVGAVIAGAAGIAGIVSVLLPTPLFPGKPDSELEVASFDAQAVAGTAEAAYGEIDAPPTNTFDTVVASVQVGLRNRGDAPTFLTRAHFTVTAQEAFATCLEIGDAVFVTESVDVRVPNPPDTVPWSSEVPISFQVAPNAVDRLEFTFSVDDMPPFVEPVVLSVDVAVQEDDESEPTPVGTARLVVPASNTGAALAGLVEEPIVEPVDGCFEDNLARMRAVQGAPALDVVAESPEFALLMGALEDRIAGRYYTPPPDDAAAPSE